MRQNHLFRRESSLAGKCLSTNRACAIREEPAACGVRQLISLKLAAWAVQAGGIAAARCRHLTLLW